MDSKHAPWLFAIEDSKGHWHDGEQCVFGDLVSAQNEVDLLNDDFDGEKEYRVVPLCRTDALTAVRRETLEEAAMLVSNMAQDMNGNLAPWNTAERVATRIRALAASRKGQHGR